MLAWLRGFSVILALAACLLSENILDIFQLRFHASLDQCCLEFSCAADEPQRTLGNSLPAINTPGSGDGHQDLLAPGPQLATHHNHQAGTSTAQARGGLTPTQSREPSFPSPARPCLSSTDVCQQGTSSESQKKTPDAKTTGKLGVALASDGHIHRQLPSETETPENAGEGGTGRLVRSFWLPPPREVGGNKGCQGGSVAMGQRSRSWVSAAWHSLRSFPGGRVPIQHRAIDS